MKKRFLSILLTSVLILSMTACGAETEETTTENNIASVIEDNNTETIKQTTTAKMTETEKAEEETTTTTVAETTTEVTTTEAAPEVAYTISKEPEYYGNYLYIDSGSIKPKTDKSYFYNISEKRLIEYNGGVNDRPFEHANQHKKTGKVFMFGEYYNNAKLINAETSEIIVSLDTNGIFPIYNNFSEDSFMVAKVEESFSGNTVYVGVISTNGEWIYPLSSEYSFCGEMSTFSPDYIFYNIYHFNSSIFGIDFSYYSFAENKWLKANYGPDSTAFGIQNGPEGLTYDSVCFNTEDTSGSFVCKYEFSTDSKSIVATKCSNCYRWLKPNSQHNTGENGHCINYDIFDDDFNCVSFDISDYIANGYEIKSGSFDDEILVMTAENDTGDCYLIVIKPDGSTIVDPIKIEYSAVISEKFSIKDNLIVGDNYILDMTKGDLRISNNEYEMIKYNKETGLMLVEVDRCYYLVDPADPDVLINPFES